MPVPNLRNTRTTGVGKSTEAAEIKKSACEIVDRYRRAWAHADGTVDALNLDRIRGFDEQRRP